MIYSTLMGSISEVILQTRQLFKTATLRQSIITSSGTIVNGILGALFYVLLARYLGPSDFGILTISLATLTLIADIADLGTNTGIVRFVPQKLISEKEAAYRFLKLSFMIKLVVWVLVLVLGISLSGFVANKIFGKAELELPLKYAMFGVGSALLFTYVTASLQAFQKFKAWSLLNIFTNALRLFLVLVFVFLQILNLESSLLIYILMPLFGFFVATFLIPSKQIIFSKNEGSVFNELFRYNSWVSVFILLAAFSSRMDTFLIGKLLKSSEVGIYGAANQIVQALPQLSAALGVVVAPKFASYSKVSEMLIYFKKLQKLVLGISGLIILLLPVSYFLIPIILGRSYSAALPIFTVLVLANLIFLISVPVHNAIFYFFSKPVLFVWISLGHLLIVTFFGYFMIVNFGLIGAALTVLMGTIFNFLAPLLWFLKKIR